MPTPKNKSKTFNEYISSFPKNIQNILQKIRQVVRENAPNAEETISYGMPAFKLNGKSLVYFAAWKNHIGFYPAGSLESFKKELSTFRKELTPYKQVKGTIKFPYDKPIPFDLLKKIVKFRVKQNKSQE